MTTQAARREFESEHGAITGYGWRKAVRLYRQTADDRYDYDIWDGYRRRGLSGLAGSRTSDDWQEIAASVAAYNVFERPIPIRVIARRLANRGYDVTDGDVVEVVAMRRGREYVDACNAAG